MATLILIFMVAGCAKDTKEALFKEGLRLLETNNSRGAAVFFRSALEKDQNFVEARFQLAHSYYLMGDLASADKEFRKVTLQDPSSREARIMLARVCLRTSRPDEALEILEGFISVASRDAEAFELAGRARAGKGDYTLAAGLLEKAVSLDSEMTTAGTALASVYMKSAKYDKAGTLIAGLLSSDPENLDASHLLVELHKSRDDFDAALRTYDRILKVYPADFDALRGKGELLANSGRLVEALRVTDELIKKFPRMPEGFRMKGILLLRENKLEDAVISLQQSLAIRSTMPTHYYLGLCHYMQGEPEQAMSHFYRALEFDPSLPQARMLVSIIHLKQNRLEDAVAETKKVLSQDGENAFAHYVLGSAYLELGMSEEGMQELERSVMLDPGLADGHVMKSLYSLGGESMGETEAELERALSATPGMLSSRVVLALNYMEQEKYQKAVTVLVEGLKGAKSDALVYNLIAEAFQRQNSTSDAVRYLNKAKESDPDYLASYFRLSSLYLSKGAYEESIAELKVVTERMPGNTRALLLIASLYEHEGRYGDALEYYITAAETGHPEGSISLAKFYLMSGKPDKALHALNRGIEETPMDVTLQKMKGKVLLSMKRFRDAVGSFERLESISPGRGMPYILNTYVSMGKPEEALRKIDETLREHPEKLGLAAERSRIYTVMGRKQDAIENAKRIIKLKPGSPVGYMALAAVYRDGKDLGGAINVLKRADVLEEDRLGIYTMLGDLYAAKKDFAAALESYGKAGELRGDHVPALFGQGAALHAMGRPMDAVEKYLKVLKVSENHVLALNNIAYIYAEDGSRLEEALRLALKAYALAPSNGRVQDTLGVAFLKSGRVEQAVKMLENAAGLTPEEPVVHYHLSLAYSKVGNTRLAIENLEKALAIGDFPESGKARLLLNQLSKG